jgi:hypothetical protein
MRSLSAWGVKDGGMKQIEFSRDPGIIEAFDLASGEKISLDPTVCFQGSLTGDLALFNKITLSTVRFSEHVLVEKCQPVK